MATHSEEPIPTETMEYLKGAVDEGAKLVGRGVDDEAEQIVASVDAFVFAWQCGKRPPKDTIDAEDAPFALGSLWGQQLVRVFDWEWRMVTFHEHDDVVAPGVLSPDRSLAIYPMPFVMGCLDDPGVDATIMLSYNMIKAGKLGETKPGEYTNVMECVHRIVPRVANVPKKPWWKRMLGK